MTNMSSTYLSLMEGWKHANSIARASRFSLNRLARTGDEVNPLMPLLFDCTVVYEVGALHKIST